MARLDQVRRRRINDLLRIISDVTLSGRSVIKEKLIAELSLKWGCARRTALEYIDALINSDHIKEIKSGKMVLLISQDKTLEYIEDQELLTKEFIEKKSKKKKKRKVKKGETK